MSFFKDQTFFDTCTDKNDKNAVDLGINHRLIMVRKGYSQQHLGSTRRCES